MEFNAGGIIVSSNFTIKAPLLQAVDKRTQVDGMRS